MYTTLDQVWNGWARLALPGLGDRWFLLPLSVFGILGTALYFGVALGPGARGSAPGWAIALNIATLAYLLLFMGFLRWKIGRLVGQADWHTLTYPLGVVIMVGIGFAAILRSLLGLGTEFRGRRYG
jgi:hypothetical protein